jgi:hypothetical protein
VPAYRNQPGLRGGPDAAVITSPNAEGTTVPGPTIRSVAVLRANRGIEQPRANLVLRQRDQPPQTPSINYNYPHTVPASATEHQLHYEPDAQHSQFGGGLVSEIVHPEN